MSLRTRARVAYSARTEALLALGFATYDAYLRSELWASIRLRVFALHGTDCYACGERAGQVHHGDYSLATLRGDDLSGLYQVCRECHKWAEFSGRTKNAPGRATAKLAKRRKRRGAPARPRQPAAPHVQEPPPDRTLSIRVRGLMIFQEPPWGTMTVEELDLYRSKRGGWGGGAFAALGLPNPPPKGWRKRLLRPASCAAPVRVQIPHLPTLADIGRADGTWPTIQEVDAAETGCGGFTRVKLEALGVPWPPPGGWRNLLREKAQAATRSAQASVSSAP